MAPFLRSHRANAACNGTIAPWSPQSLASPSKKPRGKFRVAQLPNEILALILEQLAGTPDLARSRLVSKRFEDLAAPILYRQIKFSTTLGVKIAPIAWLVMHRSPLPDNFSSPEYLAYKKANHFAKYIFIDKVGSIWEPVLSLVPTLGSLQFVTFSCRIHDRLVEFSNILQRLHSEQPHLRFSIDNFYIAEGSPNDTTSPQSMFTWPPCVVSLKNTAFRPSDFEANIKPLLGCTGLQKLHLTGSHYSRAFRERDVPQNVRMPAIQELLLEHYCWDHSAKFVASFWDFSKLTHLELRDVCVVKFLKTVSLEHLRHLRTLVLDPRCQSVEHVEVSNLVSTLLHKIDALENLKLRCRLLQALPAITKHANTLRSLEFRSSHGPSSDAELKVLPIMDVELIRDLCQNLVEFTTRVSLKPCDELHMRSPTIPQMRNLRRLELQTLARQKGLPSSERRESYQELHSYVIDWFRWVLAMKTGVKFETVWLDVAILDEGWEEGGNTARCVHLMWNYTEGNIIGPAFVHPDPSLGFLTRFLN
ncbi:hypothetical protein ACLMJK_009224 [Lecanora helva]